MRRPVTRGAILALLLASLAVSASDLLGTLRSVERGVTVSVTPRNLAPEAASWEFAVVFDTHSQDLRDDPVRSSVLLDARNGRHEPVAWEGAPPGGHHREGVLRFKAISPPPGAIELRIERLGEATPRSFRWTLR